MDAAASSKLNSNIGNDPTNANASAANIGAASNIKSMSMNPGINSPFELTPTDAASTSCPDRTTLLPTILNFLLSMIKAPEKQLSIWIGYMGIFYVYLILCLVYAVDTAHRSNTEASSTNVMSVRMSGISGAVHDTALYVITLLCTVSTCYYWLSLVYLSPDPGMIDTRQEDFEEILNHSAAVSGAPPNHLYCRTTLVRKPLRSKYCVQSGYVIARMDHYCSWLNLSIGVKNHVTFMKFLFFHLCSSFLFVVLIARALNHDINANITPYISPDSGSSSSSGSGTTSGHTDYPLSEHQYQVCYVTESLFSRRYFFVAMLCTTQIAVTVGLLTLFVEQCYNITRNITTNERINAARYAWMKDDSGVYCNRFDRGWRSNSEEFLGIKGSAVDYSQTFLLPACTPVAAKGAGDHQLSNQSVAIE